MIINLISFAFFITKLFHCEGIIQPAAISTDVSLVSNVLLDIIDEFLLNEKIEFDIFVIKKQSKFSEQLFDIFLAKISEKILKFKIIFEKTILNSITIQHSAIFFLESIDNFHQFEQLFGFERFQNQPINFFIFTPNLTVAQLESHWILRLFPTVDVFSSSIFHHSYFILNDIHSVSLSTVEWFSPIACHRPQLTRLNTFDKKSMKWMEKLQNYEKYLQYHGCELVLMLEIAGSHGEVYDVSGYALINKEQTAFTVHGITPIIHQICGKVYNFSAEYQPVFTGSTKMVYIKKDKVHFGIFNGTFKIPNTFFSMQGSNYDWSFVRTSMPIVDNEVYVLVTPAEAYTPYEKLFLPFDVQTWILLSVTFVITFLVILIINRLSKSTQQIVYGHRVKNPFMNVVSIFFGISQTRLPIESFPRFILVLFIFFCLIFRTCYQNKIFQFMTSNPRKMPPKTIEGLIDRNYNVSSMFNSEILDSVHDKYDRK